MINERLATLETIRSLQHQERRVNWSHAFQNLALVAVLFIGGGWFACNGGSTCWAANATGDVAATGAAESQSLPSAASEPTAFQSGEVQPAAIQSEESEDSEKGKVKWLTKHDEALARAKKLGRPVLIDFAASWCVPCVMMDKHVWPDAVVQEALSSRVIPLSIDMDGKSAPGLVEKYKIEFVPTILLVDAEGNELSREGFVDAEQLLEMIKSVP